MSSVGPAAPRPRHRLIIDNDWAGDPDGLIALAHHLLSADRVDAITSSLTSPEFPGAHSGARRGADLVRELLALIGASHRPAVAAGVERAGGPRGEPSAAVLTILEHARRDDDLPLILVCAGPLTNVAAALALAPEIASRLRLVWVGGSTRGDWEYNEQTDPVAARTVLETVDLRIEQFPLETYRHTAVSLAELLDEFARTPVGRWLARRFAELPLPPGVELGEVWHLGDSLPVLATSLRGPFEPEPDDRAVVERADIRLLWGDLRVKLRRHAERAGSGAVSGGPGRSGVG